MYADDLVMIYIYGGYARRTPTDARRYMISPNTLSGGGSKSTTGRQKSCVLSTPPSDKQDRLHQWGSAWQGAWTRTCGANPIKQVPLIPRCIRWILPCRNAKPPYWVHVQMDCQLEWLPGCVAGICRSRAQVCLRLRNLDALVQQNGTRRC
jgi:hypothetical protein